MEFRGHDTLAHKVTKVTAKYFDTGESLRWRKDSGRLAGTPSIWNLRFVVPMLPEHRARLEKTRARFLARKLEPKLIEASLEQLRRIETVLSENETEE